MRRERAEARSPVETAETDQPVPAGVVIEQGEIAPWLEVAEVAGPLVSERTAAFLGQLPRQMDDLLVPPKIFDPEVPRKHRSEVAR